MATFSPCKGCVRLWRKGQLPGGTLRRLRAVRGLCGRRSAKMFCEGISRRKRCDEAAWEAVLGANPNGAGAVKAAGKKQLTGREFLVR